MRRLTLTVILLMCFWALWAHAATRYVSPSGSGSTCSEASPCSLPTGVSLSQAGDTLFLRGGTYALTINSNVDTVNSGASGNPINFQAFPGETPVIQPTGGCSSAAINLVDRHWHVWDGIHIDGSNTWCEPGTGGDGAIVLNASTHIIVKNGEARNFQYGSGIGFSSSGGAPSEFHEFLNLKIYNNGTLNTGGSGNINHGIYASGANSLFDRLEIYGNGDAGVQFYSASGGVNNSILRNSILYGNGTVSGGATAQVHVGSGDNLQVYNNVLYNGNHNCITVSSGATNAKIYSNTCVNNALGGLAIFPQAGVGTISRNNILYLNTGGYGNYNDFTAAATQSNNLQTNPVFANQAGGDFHLTPGSTAAIDAGFTLGSPYNVDAEGATRPVGTAYDIGAYEFAAQAPSIASSNCIFTTANAIEGQYLGSVNTDRAHLISQPIGLRCDVRRVGDSLTEYFPVSCRLLPNGPWTALSNTFGAIGARIATDSAVNMGDSTTVPLGDNDPIPGGGFTPVAGRFVADTIDTAQKTTLANGQYTVWEARIGFCGLWLPGDQAQCRFQRQDGSPFDDYGSSTRTITLTAPPLGRLLHGGTRHGGTVR